MDKRPREREIVCIIIMLAHNLGLQVVAEGTETQEHINLLRQLSCEMARDTSSPAPRRPGHGQAIGKATRRSLCRRRWLGGPLRRSSG